MRSSVTKLARLPVTVVVALERPTVVGLSLVGLGGIVAVLAPLIPSLARRLSPCLSLDRQVGAIALVARRRNKIPT